MPDTPVWEEAWTEPRETSSWGFLKRNFALCAELTASEELGAVAKSATPPTPQSESRTLTAEYQQSVMKHVPKRRTENLLSDDFGTAWPWPIGPRPESSPLSEKSPAKSRSATLSGWPKCLTPSNTTDYASVRRQQCSERAPGSWFATSPKTPCCGNTSTVRANARACPHCGNVDPRTCGRWCSDMGARNAGKSAAKRREWRPTCRGLINGYRARRK